MPGALELVGACGVAGLLVGLASSSPPDQIEQVLQGLGVRDQFLAVASGSEVPRSKPDPAVYLLACERLGINPREAVALEDSGPGVAAAHAAGMRCLASTEPVHRVARFLTRQRRPSLAGRPDRGRPRGAAVALACQP